jgi:hypothetical protein
MSKELEPVNATESLSVAERLSNYPDFAITREKSKRELKTYQETIKKLPVVEYKGNRPAAVPNEKDMNLKLHTAFVKHAGFSATDIDKEKDATKARLLDQVRTEFTEVFEFVTSSGIATLSQQQWDKVKKAADLVVEDSCKAYKDRQTKLHARLQDALQ